GMIESEIEHVVGFHTAGDVVSGWNLEEIYQVASTIFPVEEKLKSDLAEFTENQGKLNAVKARTAIIEHLAGLAKSNYEKIQEQFQYAIEGEMSTSRLQNHQWKEIEKAVLIRSIDTLWIEHLEAMAGMRQGIGLRGYGQRDPLIEYKKEAYYLYNELNSLIQKQVVYSIFKVGQVQEFRAPGLADRAKQFSAPAKVMEQGTSSFSGFRQVEASSGTGTRENTKTRKHENSIDLIKSKIKDASGNKVGRNDPCPCGSGKKYKKCCGK
ncbi:MAG: SEC-C metal-binding domain-containing protein, partial [Candidatus Falkowbacteria bacterium]